METQPFNLGETFLGTSPWVALADSLVRAAVVFLLALVLVPPVWRRNFTAMAPFEMSLLAAFGATGGIAIVVREVPMIAALAAMVLLALLARMVQFAAFARLWRLPTTHEPHRVAFNGRLEPHTLRQQGLTHEALFSALREAGIAHLGQVQAAYVEADGRISVLRCRPEEERAGLPVTPQGDGIARGMRLRHAITEGAYACNCCGQVTHLNTGAAFLPCPSCEGRKWVLAHPGAPHEEPAFADESASVPEKVQ